jgi:hypothetical protein
MLNNPRNTIVRSWPAHAALAALLGGALACGASAPAAPTQAVVVPAPVPISATYSVTAGVDVIAPGGPLTVSWTATSGGTRDSIALYKKGDPNTAPGWWQQTFGRTAGAFMLTAPSQEGQYEFRYLLDDEVTDTARSSVVTVTSQ